MFIMRPWERANHTGSFNVSALITHIICWCFLWKNMDGRFTPWAGILLLLLSPLGWGHSAGVSPSRAGVCRRSVVQHFCTLSWCVFKKRTVSNIPPTGKLSSKCVFGALLKISTSLKVKVLINCRCMMLRLDLPYEVYFYKRKMPESDSWTQTDARQTTRCRRLPQALDSFCLCARLEVWFDSVIIQPRQKKNCCSYRFPFYFSVSTLAWNGFTNGL